MESSKDICSLFDSYLPNHEAYTHEITWRMFSTQLWSSSKKNQIKQNSYVTVMPFTNHVIFNSREFRPPEKLEMANLLSDEQTTNSIMPKVKMSEADQRRFFSQFEVREFCDNLVEGVVKALKDVKPDFMFDKEQTIAELTFLQPEHPSSLVLFSQDFEEKPFDYPHQGPLLDTMKPLDDGLGPIFNEEDELGPTFDEKAPSMTSINMENHLCFDPGTTPTPLTTYIQEHCEKLDLINFLSEMCVKISSQDVKRFGFDKICSGNLFASTCALDEFMVKTLLEQKSLRAKIDFCCGSVLKSDLELLYSNSDHIRHVLKMSYDNSCLESILIYNTFFDKSDDPWISNSRFEIDLLCSKSETLAHVLNLFFSNCSITCLDTILVYNTYFDRLHDDLKRVLHVLGKETLVSDLNKYLSCTYDPGILMFVLSVQDKQDQSPRDKMDLRSNPFQEGENDVPFGSAPGKTDMHGLIMENSKYICSFFDPYLPNHEASTHEITWRMFSTQLWSSSKKNQITRSSYVTVMPFTNHVIFSSREFRPPEKLEIANLLSDEPMTNSIMPKVIIHVLNVQKSLGLDGLQKE
uniref:Uncharacterized protein n=1 Tax=Brassica oleracea var. oleracea TaxID=109376 RepID=A0A0D3BU80_BRAOL